MAVVTERPLARVATGAGVTGQLIEFAGKFQKTGEIRGAGMCSATIAPYRDIT
jgi:hypothetical protein